MSHIRKKIEDGRGFTLIEVLVSINLSFIVISIAAASYLLISKFILFFSVNVSEKEFIFNTMGKFEQIITQTEKFDVIISGDSLYAISDMKQLFLIKNNSVNLLDLYILNNLNYVQCEIKLRAINSNRIILWEGSQKQLPLIETSTKYSSNEIETFIINFENSGKKKIFSYTFRLPATSVAQFHNIEH